MKWFKVIRQLRFEPLESGAARRPVTARGASHSRYEMLEARAMLTSLSLFVYEPQVPENLGPAGTTAEIQRFGGDISQPLAITLSSQDETEILVPSSVVIPANEASVTFPVDVVDDMLLDGDQIVYIDAVAGLDSAQTVMLVSDVETADIVFDQASGSPGDNLTGVVTVSFLETAPTDIDYVSTRSDEIAPFSVSIPAGGQSAPFSIPVMADGIPEGAHSVRIDLASGLYGNSAYLTLSDPGVTTLKPGNDGYAEDVDQDGQVFETVNLTAASIRTRAAGYAPESRGILEFDVSGLPASTVVESAVLTLTVTGSVLPSGVTSVPINIFTYAGDGIIQSADANEMNTEAGQFTVESGIAGLRSYAIPLSTVDVQVLIDGGDYLGLLTATGPAVDGTSALASYLSSEIFYSERQPSLHLVISTAESPVLTANSLSIDEGETVTLTSSDLAATDFDTDDASLTFFTSNVIGGQFLLDGAPASSFALADITLGKVAFQHDDGEIAPSYSVVVSDGNLSDGPDSASINFTSINDQAPMIPAGQIFSVSEAAANGATVGTVSFSDADLPGDSFSVNIVAGDADGVFQIDDAGRITIADNMNLDFEVTSSYALTVEVSDGVHSSGESVRIDVTDVNDNAPVLTANALSISEGQWLFLSGSNFAATDIDSDDETLTFSVSNVVGGQFYLGITGPVPTTSFTQFEVTAGHVSFQHDDGELAPAYDLIVSDGSLGSGPFASTVSFSNVNDQAPVVPAGQSFSVSEAAADGTLVGTVSFSDADLPGDMFGFSIVAGDMAGVFAISDAGEVTVADNATLDFETTSSYSLTVEVFDGVNTSSQDVTVDVTDVSETKFYVVDASSGSTFEYEASGAMIETYLLAGGKNEPRGAAADATGTTIWVIDDDEHVYVYDGAGNLQGQWQVNGLNHPEGIASDGTDVWIVDRGSDKVLRFLGGASFTSGSHVADSSFSLNLGNKAPMGITTDGSNLWVVNSRKNIDEVFKYTLSGSLLGSWSIDDQNATPEGITIDPTNVDSIWIADRGTGQVFEYKGGANRTSGSQNADSVFDLAPTNADPRGIADPPAARAPETDRLALHVEQRPISSPSVLGDKYTLSGSRLRSESINNESITPENITIDLTNIDSIWIADPGTRQVFEYIDGANSMLVRRNAASVFDLAANNVEPFGMADSPAAVSPLTNRSGPYFEDLIINSSSVLDNLFAEWIDELGDDPEAVWLRLRA